MTTELVLGGREEANMVERLVAMAALALVAAGCSSAPGSSTGATHIITGTLDLSSTENIADLAPGQPCTVGLGFSDIQPGASVTVKNASGTIIATGQLGSGTTPGTSGMECDFTFKVNDVPTSSFYQVEVANRGNVSYSLSQMEQDKWKVSLSLGS